eukprot:jgi/Tetstr1/439619/TSEL_028041.t1
MHRHQQPVGLVSPAEHQNQGHQQANNNSNQRPTRHHEAFPFVGVSPSAQHRSSLPIMLTYPTAAPGGAATGAQEGAGEDNAEDDLHDPWHVPYSDSDDDFESPLLHPWRVHHFRPHLDTFAIFTALASHVLREEQGALRGDPPPTLPLLTAAPILHMPTAMGVDHLLFSPCHQQQSVNRQPSPRATAPYVLEVIDDWQGPCPSVTGAQHNFGAVDSHTSVKVAITMRTKDEAVRAVHQLHAAVLGMGHAIQHILFQFSNNDHLVDEPQPSDQREGPQAPPPMPPSAALASAQEGPPPPHQDEQYLPRHQEGDATALPAPHSSRSAQLTSPYFDLSDYLPTLVASAIVEVVRTYSAQMAALALPAPTVRVSKAPRNYKEAISSNHPDDWKQSMDRGLTSSTKMETFVWISVPELRRNNPSAIIMQTAWTFADTHDKDVNLVKRKARVVVRGDQLYAGENYDDTKAYAPVASFIALRTTIALAVPLDWELYTSSSHKCLPHRSPR